MKTTEPEVTTTATPATDKAVDATKLAIVKPADAKPATAKTTPDTATTVAKPDKPAKAAGDQASYLAIALHKDLKARLDATAKAEGVSSAAIVRRAVLAQFAAHDNADAAINGKVDQITTGLDAALAKLARVDKAIDSALADCVRVADRLAKAIGEID